jgi:hypothetical protein
MSLGMNRRMRTVIIICRDDTRREFLAEVTQYAPKSNLDLIECATVTDVSGSSIPKDVPFIIVSLVGGGDGGPEISILRQRFPKARIIVELDDDDVERAFEMLRFGAFNVVSGLITRTALLWDIFTKAIVADLRPYGPLIDVGIKDMKKGTWPWGFMSMPFDATSPAHGDYFFAICPTMKRLGLDLRRMDEMTYEGIPRLQEKAREAISACPVFVTLVSYLTANCLLEIGLALANKKTLILLWRPDTGAMPEILKGQFYVEYATMTELAMKLFFGLGGNNADLRRVS